MIAVRLDDGTTVYAFGRFSVVAKSAAGHPDRFWQQAAETHLTELGGDMRAGLLSLPGARLIHDGQVTPPAVTTTAERGATIEAPAQTRRRGKKKT